MKEEKSFLEKVAEAEKSGNVCSICNGDCFNCYYAFGCDVYNGTGNSTPISKDGWIVG